MKNTFILFLLLNVFYSCEQSNQKDTYAELYVRYDADIKELTAEADFHELHDGEMGESKVFSSGVQFINSGMRTVELADNKIQYKAGISGLMPKEVYFNWYGKDGKAVTITAPITKINGFEIAGDTISLSNGMPIYLNTSNLGDNEKLVISISDSNGKSKNLETKGPTTTTKFKIPGNEFKGLSEGEAYLYIVRSTVDEINGESHKTIINAEYYTHQRKVKIVK